MHKSGMETRGRIYTVTELTRHLKRLIEDTFPFVWICGEISNFRRPVSGHNYFTLKDDRSQISAVLFRGQAENLKFTLKDGLQVTGFGRLSVYEPRGAYQVILEYLDPGGIGALQLAYEQLKSRLSAEGLFDAASKRPIPFLPKKISVVTSPTGAVIHDILTVIHRRFFDLHVEIVPVSVQGSDAAGQIVAALDLLNRRQDTDVVILARGGGSLEDLQAFNDESVARAIVRSTIPVVSAVGHETDYCIADFTADLRAPTPSAAAEWVVPIKHELDRRVRELSLGLASRLKSALDRQRARLSELTARLRDPQREIQDLRLRTDDLALRLCRIIQTEIGRKRDILSLWNERLYANNPIDYIIFMKEKLSNNNHNLEKYIDSIFINKRHHLSELSGRLRALNPTAILNRGYSITRTIPDAAVIRDSRTVNDGQQVEILLKKGILTARVVHRTP